jgi:ADP-ribose pyrophosphatase
MAQVPVFAHPPWVFVFIDDVTENSPGYIRIREGDGRPGAVVLALRDDHIALVNVYRRPLRRSMWELPRGFAEPGESPVQAARRELLEETGLAVDEGHLEALGVVAPNSGILESEVALYVARVPLEVGSPRPLDHAEVHQAEWVPTQTVADMVSDGRIVDGFTIAALARALLKGLIAVGKTSPSEQ